MGADLAAWSAPLLFACNTVKFSRVGAPIMVIDCIWYLFHCDEIIMLYDSKNVGVNKKGEVKKLTLYVNA